MPDEPLPPARTTDVPFDSDAPPEKPEVHIRDVMDEALRKHAASRKPVGPPKEMPETPTLPRQPRPARDRKRRRKFG